MGGFPFSKSQKKMNVDTSFSDVIFSMSHIVLILFILFAAECFNSFKYPMEARDSPFDMPNDFLSFYHSNYISEIHTILSLASTL